MPSIITHYLCGENSINILKDKRIENIIEEHRQVFNLGTQGPDIFFFGGINHICFHKTGHLMHSEKISDCFENALNYARNQDEDIKTLLASYIMGFACHYALDCTAHPYIYYKSGFLRKGEHKTFKYSIYHHRLEKAIDILMLGREHQINPWDIKVEDLIRVEPKVSMTLGSMYQKLFQNVYKVKVKSSDAAKASSNMIRFHTYMRDNSGRKTTFLSKVDKYFPLAQLIEGLMYQHRLTDNLDYINEQHMAWYLPWNNKVEQTCSFYDMFQQAVKEAARLYEVIYSYLFDNMSIDEALYHIKNRSFATGEDWRKPLEFKYYNCIFE